MKWEKVKIKEICSEIISGGTPKSNILEFYYPKEIPWLKTKEVNYCQIYDTEMYISKKGLEKSSAKLLPVNSVIVAMYGQGNTAGRVAINKIPLCTNQACCNLIINNKIADYKYVYYSLVILYDKLVSLKNGGAQPNLNVGIIKDIEIPLPKLQMQKKITSILSAYDDLVENNQKQIKLLEEAAQRLYKEWFVDLRFPGYENTPIIDGVPEGWSKGCVGDIAVFKRGKTITKTQIIEGNVPVVAGGIEPAYYHNKANTIAPVITVSASGANAGFTKLYYNNVFASDCSFADAKTTSCLYYIYAFLKDNKLNIDALQKGSAQPHVYAKDINAMELIIPCKQLILDYCYCVSGIFSKIKILFDQINKLTEARDRVLSKLVNGEIEG